MLRLSEFLATPIAVLAPLEHEACCVCGRRVVGESEFVVDGCDVHEECHHAVLGSVLASDDVTFRS